MFDRNRFLIGQYRPGTGPVYRLDPRTKIIIILLIMVLVLTSTSLYFYGALVLIQAGTLAACRLGWRFILSNLRPIVWFVALTSLFHLIFSGRDDPHVIMTVLGWSLTAKAVTLAATYSARIVIFVLSTFVLSLTTNPVAIAEGVVSLLGPLRLVRVPIYDLGMILFIALRFIPVLADEIETIRKVQMIRGISFSGAWRKRISQTTALVMPILFSALRRADDLAVAIYTRGYQSGKPRGSLHPLKFRQADYLVLMLSIGAAAGYLVGRRFI